MFDDTEVAVETLTAKLTVTAPSEIATYAKAFPRLAEIAVYGSSAHKLIAKTIGAQG